jgi:hypothetical protein
VEDRRATSGEEVIALDPDLLFHAQGIQGREQSRIARLPLLERDPQNVDHPCVEELLLDLELAAAGHARTCGDTSDVDAGADDVVDQPDLAALRVLAEVPRQLESIGCGEHLVLAQVEAQALALDSHPEFRVADSVGRGQRLAGGDELFEGKGKAIGAPDRQEDNRETGPHPR